MIDAAMKADGLSGDAQGLAAIMVGAMTLARAVNDSALSDSFLESGRRTVRMAVMEAKSTAKSAAVGRAKKA